METIKISWNAFFVAVMIVVTLFIGCAREKPTGSSNQIRAYRGTLYGVITVPRDSLPQNALPESVIVLDQWYAIGPNRAKVSLLADGNIYEFSRTLPTDSFTVSIDGQPVLLHPDGTFEVNNIVPGKQEIVFKVHGEIAHLDSIEITNDDTASKYELMYMPGTCPQHQHVIGPELLTIPCLDNNGVGSSNFVYSDCFTSLIYGDPRYNWMCWLEAMNIFHDHHGNIWCNGSHNCSLWVHHWNWNAQFWHRHYSLWFPWW